MSTRLGLRLPSRQKKEREPLGPYGRVGKAVEELDERLGIAKGGKTFLDKIFPDHWSFMLGEIALYSFVILLATGVFLTLYYIPSSGLTVCHTPYVPIDGQITSQAFCSTVSLSFSVTGQLVHWVKESCRCALEIVKRSDKRQGFEVLPHRWVVERTFGWFNRYRRLAKDYERSIESSEAMLYIAMIRLMLARLARKPQTPQQSCQDLKTHSSLAA